MYNYEDIIAVHLEPTERCQAACPMCPRTGNTQLTNAELTFEDFKKIFPDDFLKKLKYFTLCGNYGEPIVAVDFMKMVKYLRQVNPDLIISVHTNAGARPGSWWVELAEVLGRKGIVKFGVDGLEDTNHIYRVGIRWNILFNAMKSFAGAGGRAWWDFIAFEHNEHQIDEAKKLSEELGFEKFRIKRSYRFGIYKDVKLNPPKNYVNPAMPLFDQPKEFFDQTRISCRVDKQKEIYITAEGLLFPCCWIGGTIINEKSKDLQILDFIGDKSFVDCKTKSIKEVMDSGYIQKIADSWNLPSVDQGRMRVCTIQCSEKYNLFKSQYDD